MMEQRLHYRKRLKRILVEKSVKRGGVCTLLRQEERLLPRPRLKPQPKAIGGPTLGADPIDAAVAALSQIDLRGKPLSQLQAVM